MITKKSSWNCIYLRPDIDKIDDDILDNMQQYYLINLLSDGDGVDLNIDLSRIEKWLIMQFQNGKQNWSLFYERIAQRFNISSDELRFSNDRDCCILICFLEQLKKLGHKGDFEFYVEGVLHINGEIIDNEVLLADITLNK